MFKHLENSSHFLTAGMPLAVSEAFFKSAIQCTCPGCVKKPQTVESPYQADIAPPTGHPDKFSSVRILTVTHPKATVDLKLALRRASRLFADDISQLHRSLKYLPELIHTSPDWFAFEFIDGVSEKDYIAELFNNPRKQRCVAIQAAQVLSDFAQDGLILDDINFSNGHNVILKPKKIKLKLFDWDSFTRSNDTPEKTLIDWMMRHLYTDVIKQDYTRPFQMACSIYFFIFKELLKKHPQLESVTKPVLKLRRHKKNQSGFIEAMVRATQGDERFSITTNTAGQTVVTEQFIKHLKLSPKLLTILKKGTLEQFSEFLENHIDYKNCEIRLFE